MDLFKTYNVIKELLWAMRSANGDELFTAYEEKVMEEARDLLKTLEKLIKEG